MEFEKNQALTLCQQGKSGSKCVWTRFLLHVQFAVDAQTLVSQSEFSILIFYFRNTV